jgi:hypothetical protein
MANLFSKTQTGQQKQQQTPERMLLIRELRSLLTNSQFLTDGERKKMENVIPLFSDEVIKELQKTLIRQNLRYLQRKMLDTVN